MVEQLGWFLLGVGATLAALIIGAMIAIVIDMENSPLNDSHYVD